MKACECTYRRSPDDACTVEMTQEDGLCDQCRHLHPQRGTGWTVTGDHPVEVAT